MNSPLGRIRTGPGLPGALRPHEFARVEAVTDAAGRERGAAEVDPVGRRRPSSG